MKSVEKYRGIAVGGSTKVIAIFGDPLTYTLSPKMHNFALSELGLDYVYVPFVVKPDQLEKATQALRSLNFAGANITIPHKQKIVPFLDDLTPLAKKIGAVNTVIRKDSKLVGDNTDAQGFLDSLKEDGHFNPKNKRAVLLGSGGTAYALSVALLDAGVQNLVVMNRTLNRAKELVSNLKAHYPKSEISAEKLSLTSLNSCIKQCDLFLNATPGGMELELIQIPPNVFVFDAVYAALTPLILAAQKSGAPFLSGLGMLVRQGALSFSLWTGHSAPIDLMKKALEDS